MSHRLGGMVRDEGIEGIRQVDAQDEKGEEVGEQERGKCKYGEKYGSQ